MPISGSLKYGTRWHYEVAVSVSPPCLMFCFSRIPNLGGCPIKPLCFLDPQKKITFFLVFLSKRSVCFLLQLQRPPRPGDQLVRLEPTLGPSGQCIQLHHSGHHVAAVPGTWHGGDSGGSLWKIKRGNAKSPTSGGLKYVLMGNI